MSRPIVGRDIYYFPRQFAPVMWPVDLVNLVMQTRKIICKDHFAPQRYFIDCIGPQQNFIEQQREKDRFFTDDSHRSAAGTDLVAHILQEHIGPR